MTFCFLRCWRRKLPGCPPRASWGGTAPSVTQLRNRTAMPEPARRSACGKTRRPHSRGRCARQRPRASLTMSDRADEEDRTAFPRRSLPFLLRTGLSLGGAAGLQAQCPRLAGLAFVWPSCPAPCSGPGCPGSHAVEAQAPPPMPGPSPLPGPCVPLLPGHGPATVLTVGGAQTRFSLPSGVLFAASFRGFCSPPRSGVQNGLAQPELNEQ